MEIKSIAESRKQGIGENIHDILTLNWIFSTPLEKGIVAVCILWSVYSLGRFIWNLI